MLRYLQPFSASKGKQDSNDPKEVAALGPLLDMTHPCFVMRCAVSLCCALIDVCLGWVR